MKLPRHCTFSILERIDVGETLKSSRDLEPFKFSFSILERIDVGETGNPRGGYDWTEGFQYPRTDRRG